MRTKRGFTLIELLVVIVIIAILAAILFPVFGRARDKARSVSCSSNMKQMATALKGYLADNDGKFPLSYMWTSTPYPKYPDPIVYYSGADSWPVVLAPYTGGKPILHCRNDRGSAPYSYGYNRNLGGHFKFRGYSGAATVEGLNAWVSTIDTPSTGHAGYSRPYWGVTIPTKCVSFFETTNWDDVLYDLVIDTDTSVPPDGIPDATDGVPETPGVEVYGEGTDIPQPVTDTSLSHSRHSGGANYAFADGHSEWLRPVQIRQSSTGSLGGTVSTTAPPPDTLTADLPGGTDIFTAPGGSIWTDGIFMPDGYEDVPGPDATNTHPTFAIGF